MPSTPAAPTTSVVGNKVVIDWSAPADNGTPILGYRLSVRRSDDTYSEPTTDCDASDSDIVAATQCEVLLDTLTAAPYNLGLSQSINAKVIAYNAYGDSIESSVGGGAVILLVPDAPTNLSDAPLVTTDEQIGLTWSEGASTGGTPVIDYEV